MFKTKKDRWLDTYNSAITGILASLALNVSRDGQRLLKLDSESLHRAAQEIADRAHGLT